MQEEISNCRNMYNATSLTVELAVSHRSRRCQQTFKAKPKIQFLYPKNELIAVARNAICHVPGNWNPSSLTLLSNLVRNCQSLLHLQWCLNKLGHHPSDNVPINMTMQKPRLASREREIPNTWVIGAKCKNSVSTCIDENDVPTDRIIWEVGHISGIEMSYILFAAIENLECMPMEMD
jgi:hypothetical protein